MVYKKYIKRGGKLFGPYYYRSIKKGGKVITQYVKNPNDFPKKKFSIGYKKINKNFLILPILFLILIAGFFILKPVLTGKVILSVDNSYVSQEALFGELKLNLEPNEFIPADTKVLINNEEFILRNLIKEIPKPGEFYVSGTEISGKGEGYGSGNPEVFFVLNILSEKEKDKEISKGILENETTESNEAEEETETIESNETKEEIPAEITTSEIPETEESPRDDTGEPQTPIEEIEETTPATGQIILNFFNKIFLTITGKTALENVNEVSGRVSKDKPIVYALEQGQTAEIKNSNEKVNLEIINNTATITTDYSGERAEYLINLSELNILTGQNEFEIKLIYNDTEFASIVKNVKFESNETNITGSSVIFENLTEEIIQHTAIAGKPVKWTKKIKADSRETNVLLPKEAENISIYKLENTIAADLNNSITGSLILSYEKENPGFFNRLFAFITGRAVEIIERQEEIEINISENANSDYEIEYFTPGPEITEKNISNGKEIVISSEVNYENILAYTALPENINLEEIKLYHKINDSTPDGVSSGEVRVLVDFIAYTEDNKIVENENDLDDDVLNEIENKVLKKEENEIMENKSLDKPYRNIIYGEEIQEKLDYQIKKIRTESKEKVSYIEWIVPHLSNQTYELILISKAEHLDENKTFIEDVYEQVKERDGNFTNEIPAKHYIRVTFEKNLTNENDITIYAKAGCNGSIKINEIDVPCEIYEKKMRLDSLRGENG